MRRDAAESAAESRSRIRFFPCRLKAVSICTFTAELFRKSLRQDVSEGRTETVRNPDGPVDNSERHHRGGGHDEHEGQPVMRLDVRAWWDLLSPE